MSEKKYYISKEFINKIFKETNKNIVKYIKKLEKENSDLKRKLSWKGEENLLKRIEKYKFYINNLRNIIGELEDKKIRKLRIKK